MRIAGSAVLCFVVGLVLPGVSSGQALVEYGHAAARAGAAGAGAGTGLAGILTKMKNSTEKGAKGSSSRSATPRRPEFDAEDLRSNRQTTDNTSSKMTTSSGIVVSGIPSTPLGGGYARRAPGSVEVQQVSWSSPEEPDAGQMQETVAADGSSEEATAGAEAVPPAEATLGGASNGADSPIESEGPAATRPGPFKPIYAESQQASADAAPTSIVEAPASAQPQPVVATAESLGVSIGDDIDQVVEKLGKPAFAFKGIIGQGYTEKYVFKTADGGRLVVLTWHGKVASVFLG